LARALHKPASGEISLPLQSDVKPVPSGCVAIYVSEAVKDLYLARPGEQFQLLNKTFPTQSAGANACFFVAGIWRDYAHQFGSIAIDLEDLAAITRLQGAPPITDISVWLTPSADPAAIEQSLRTLADQQALNGNSAPARMLDFADARDIRERTMRIFDRSFAVTYWLQAVAIGIGLFGVATSISAQILARRKEFGLLVHLGLTRKQIVGLLALESALWATLGSVGGTALGLLVAQILVRIVNPQSFHWTMDLHIPWLHLAGMALSVVAASAATAWLAGRHAASRDAVRAVREDW